MPDCNDCLNDPLFDFGTGSYRTDAILGGDSFEIGVDDWYLGNREIGEDIDGYIEFTVCNLESISWWMNYDKDTGGVNGYFKIYVDNVLTVDEILSLQDPTSPGATLTGTITLPNQCETLIRIEGTLPTSNNGNIYIRFQITGIDEFPTTTTPEPTTTTSTTTGTTPNPTTTTTTTLSGTTPFPNTSIPPTQPPTTLYTTTPSNSACCFPPPNTTNSNIPIFPSFTTRVIPPLMINPIPPTTLNPLTIGITTSTTTTTTTTTIIPTTLTTQKIIIECDSYCKKLGF